MVYESGNEMAAYAAHQINYHIMGYFPISPSTEVAQFLDLMKANGQHDIKLIPADGEHGSAGICYGASDSRRTRVQRDERQRLPVHAGTDAGAIRHAVPDGDEPGLPFGIRAAEHPRRPFGPVFRAEYGLADPAVPRSASGVRHEHHGDQTGGTSGSAPAGHRRVRTAISRRHQKRRVHDVRAPGRRARSSSANSRRKVSRTCWTATIRSPSART